MRSYVLFLLATKKIEGINVDFGHLTLNLIFVLPRTSAELSLYVELRTFANVSLGDFGILAPHHYVVPLGAFGHLCAIGSSIAALGSGKRERCDSLPGGSVANVGVATDVAYKNYFIYLHIFFCNVFI